MDFGPSLPFAFGIELLRRRASTGAGRCAGWVFFCQFSDCRCRSFAPSFLTALMNWVTVIWSMVAGASLAMALPHVLIAVKQRGAWVNLLFAIAALAVAGTAVAEMAMMHAQTTKQIGRGASVGARASLCPGSRYLWIRPPLLWHRTECGLAARHASCGW